MIMIAQRLQQLLDSNQVSYRVVAHPSQPTAQEAAHSAHISGRRFAKTVLLRRGGEPPSFILAVLPANQVVDLDRLSSALGVPVELASEDDLGRLFPGFEIGAMPPFGELAGIPVVADSCLEGETRIAFNAGTHTDVVEMPWDDYRRIAHPQVLEHTDFADTWA